MERIFGEIILALFALLGIKAMVGFHFPWESIVKTKKRLRENLDIIKSKLPSSVYEEMQDDIENIC